MDSENTINDMKKYVPFIDYCIEHEVDKKNKFKAIKHWILTNRRLNKQDLINIKKATTMQFRKMTMGGYNIPEELKTLFINKEKLLPSTVDLCSDDETEEPALILHSKEKKSEKNSSSKTNEEVLILESDDEVEIVSDNAVLIRPEEKEYLNNNNNNNNNNNTNQNKMPEHKENSIVPELPKTTLICIDDSSSDDEVEKRPKAKSWWNAYESGKKDDTNVGEEVLFHRRGQCDLPSRNVDVPLTSCESQPQPQQQHPNIQTNTCTIQGATYSHPLRLNDPRVKKMLDSIKNTPLAPYLQTSLNIAATKVINVPNENTIPNGNYLNRSDQSAEKHAYNTGPRTYKEYKENKKRMEEEKRKNSENKCEDISKQNCHNMNSTVENRNMDKIEETADTFPSSVPKVHKKKSPKKIPKKNADSESNISKTTKALSNLECSIKGFDNTLMNLCTPTRKRTSSIFARSSIAQQLSETSSPKKQRTRSPSTDSDAYLPTFDMPSNNIEIVLEECFVRLKRIPHEVYLKEMLKLTNYEETLNEKALHTELVVGMVKRDCNVNNTVKQRNKHKLKVYNTNIQMTEKTTKFCVLCRSKAKLLTKHYVQFHKSESYVARLSAEDLLELNESIPYAEPRENEDIFSDERIYEVECGFKCNEKLIMPFNDLFDHYAKHTGEYAYECVQCNLPVADKTERLNHRKSKSCKSKKFRTLYLYPNGLKTIYLHCCKLCNFVQLNEANTFRHLRNHHNKTNDDESYIERVILCTISDDYTNNKENINDLQESLIPLNNTNDVVVHNEPLNEDIPVADEAEIEIDIKPSIQNFVNIGYLTNNECDENKHLDKHQPIAVKTEEQIVDFEAISMSFGFFKCKGTECSYTTDIDTEMIEHLNDHMNSYLPSHRILECPYCTDEQVFSAPNELISHMTKHHSSRRYQCSNCEYRSSLKENVLVHFQICHLPNQQECEVIYECQGTQIDFNGRQKYMRLVMAKNVQPLYCNYCDYSSFRVSAMNLHYTQTHKDQNIDDIQLKAYACIYCKENMSTRIQMQQHIAINHPDELNFACYREMTEESTKECIESLALLDITVINAEMIKVINVVQKSEEIQIEKLVQIKEEKPTPEMLLNVQFEVVKASLKKLSAHTGIPPDRLYICREENCCAVVSNFSAWHRHMFQDHHSLIYSCPHCKNVFNNEDAKLMETHFLTHRRHTYLCYECGETFVTEENIQKHAGSVHPEQIMRLERIQFNRKYAYFISVSNDFDKDRFTFLSKLQETVLSYIKKQKEVHSQQLHTKWPVPLEETCLDEYLILHASKSVKCFVTHCKYSTPSLTDLLKHIRCHNLENRPFACFDCKISFPCGRKNEYDIIQHMSQHRDNQIFICCICSKSSINITSIFEHIVLEHNKRDAYIISLTRSQGKKSFGLMVLFADYSHTFKTTTTCFCCQENNVECLAIHLREQHQILLTYGCVSCNEVFDSLSKSLEHFNAKHGINPQSKLYATLKSYNNLVVSSVNPFKLDCHYLLKTNVELDKKDTDKDILAIYEGDDLIIVQETKKNKENKQNIGFKINCINVSKLQQ